MRATFPLALCTVLLSTRTSAQSLVKIRFDFDADPRPATTSPGEIGNVLAQRTALRAWTDSVDVYLDQVALAVREKGWARARERENTNYLVSITALPVLVNQQPTGMVVYSLVVFQPGTLSRWDFVQNYVGYSSGAQEAVWVEVIALSAMNRNM